MTTTEYDDDILTLDDVERVFREVLENSWPLPREDLERAVDEFADWALTAGMVWAWLARKATLGWRADTQELVLIPNASAPTEGSLLPPAGARSAPSA